MFLDEEKVSSEIERYYEKYEAAVKHGFNESNILSLKQFFQVYHKEEKAIDEEESHHNKTPPTIEFFAEIFNKIDEYPSNLQKPKKVQPAGRERLNSTICKSSQSLNDLTITTAATTSQQQKDTSLILINIMNKPSATETYSNFKKFQKQIKILQAELAQEEIEKEYALKLKKLNMFSQQLEKLLPSDKVGKSALSPQNEEALKHLVASMDDLCFLRLNQNIFYTQNFVPSSLSSSRLDNLMEILSHCLIAINSFS